VIVDTTAQAWGYFLWVLLFLPFFQSRMVYVCAAVVVGLISGYQALEYLPFWFVWIEAIIEVGKVFHVGGSRRWSN